MSSHRAAGVTIVTDDLQHAARHAAPPGSGGGGGGAHVAPRVVQPKWIFDQICPPARAEEREEGTAAEARAAAELPGAAWQPEGTSGLDPGAESDGSGGYSEEY